MNKKLKAKIKYQFLFTVKLTECSHIFNRELIIRIFICFPWSWTVINHTINTVRRLIKQNLLNFLFDQSLIIVLPCYLAFLFSLGSNQFIVQIFAKHFLKTLLWLSFGLFDWKEFILHFLELLAVRRLSCLESILIRLMRISSLEFYVNVFLQILLEFFKLVVRFWLYLNSAFRHRWNLLQVGFF